MTRALLALVTLGIGLVCARADDKPEVTLELMSDQPQYLPAERLPITVRVSNFSGRSLKFGRDNQWLSFTLEEVKGGVVNRRSDPNVEGEFELETASRGKFRLDISKNFDLSRPGSYRLTAQMRVPELGLIVNSEPFTFDVVPGSILWSQTFGVPQKPGEAEGTVDRRTYLLQQANFLKQVKLYVRVTDASRGTTYAIFPIGPIVSFSKPQTLIDKLGRLNLLHQFGMRVCLFHLISPDGEILERRTYEIGESRPTLRVNDQSEVIVLGGVRRPDRTDLPAPVTTDAPIPQPAAPAPAPAGVP